MNKNKGITRNYIYGKIIAILTSLSIPGFRQAYTSSTSWIRRDLQLGMLEISKMLKSLEEKLEVKFKDVPDWIYNADYELGQLVSWIFSYVNGEKIEPVKESMPTKTEVLKAQISNLVKCKNLLDNYIGHKTTILTLEKARKKGQISIRAAGQDYSVKLNLESKDVSEVKNLKDKLDDATDTYINTMIGMREKDLEDKLKEIKKLLS